MNAVFLGLILKETEMMGGIQQSLGRNASGIKAGAAGDRYSFIIQPIVYTGRRESQLGTAYCSRIAAGAGSDHHDIKVFHIGTCADMRLNLQQQPGGIFDQLLYMDQKTDGNTAVDNPVIVR